MDATYRSKRQKVKSTADTAKARRKGRSRQDEQDSVLRPRETHPDLVDSKKRIKGNLKQLNKRLAEPPAVVDEEENSVAALGQEDQGARVVTERLATKAKVPYFVILGLAVILFVSMYVLYLFVQVQEYSASIAEMERTIAELKEESTRLEVQLESKYDLDEVERIATQEYGMVVASTLPKKYISVSEEEDVWTETVKEEPEANLLDTIIQGIRTFFGKTEE